jgi:hypothetical protein
VRLTGHVDHPEFRDTVRILNSEAQLAGNNGSPELAIIAQSRPGQIGEQEVQRLRREAPLAGIVGLLGTWCEGETRTGRPWPGVLRLYWYEFPPWWRRQVALRAAGRCPDWARPGDFGLLTSRHEHPASRIQHPASSIHIPTSRGLIAIHTRHRDTADALADTFQHAGFATVWQRPGRATCVLRGVTAAIWDGSQLDDFEADALARFCRSLASDAAPVVALLDFPRRDSVDRAMDIGAAAVLGKPWRNDELINTVQIATSNVQRFHAA